MISDDCYEERMAEIYDYIYANYAGYVYKIRLS